MIKWLAWLFIVWVAITFVASANEEILQGGQQLVKASNEAASATTSGHAALPPIERESRTADNALNTGKKARLQTDESDDALLAIGLGTRGAYPSYPGSFGQSSKSGVISVLTKNPIHLGNSDEPFKLKINDHQLFPSGVSLKQVNLQASRRTTRREFLSDFDKTRESDASASTEDYRLSPTNPWESLSESFNLRRNTQLQIDAPITRRPLGNSGTHKQDEGRGTKRKIWESWGHLLSLKTGITSDENDTQHSYATQDSLSGLINSEQPNRAEENCIATPQFSSKEIQQAIRLFQPGSSIRYYQNAGASMAPVLSSGGRIPWKMSSIDGKNGGNVLSSLNSLEQGKNSNSGADQQTTSSPISQPKKSLRVKPNSLVDWPRSTEPLLNQSPMPQHNYYQSGNKASSSGNPPQVSKMLKPHQPKTIMAFGNYPFQIDGIKNYGRLKFDTNLFTGEGPYQLERSRVVILLNSIPKPSKGKSLLTDLQLFKACESLRSRRTIISKPSTTQIGILMGNINTWYQYWSQHAKIDLDSLHDGGKLLRWHFVFPLFLLYVEMIISIVPFKQGLPVDAELNYPQEMTNAFNSYLEFNRNIENPPDKIWMEKKRRFNENLAHAGKRPAGIVWTFIDYWMESHYTAVWNKVVESNGLYACDFVKVFFNTIFTYGIETLNEKLCYYILHD